MGQTECVKLLLGCLPELDIERKDGQGRTALWHAVQEQRDDIVALLVEAGARLYYEGITIIHCIFICGTVKKFLKIYFLDIIFHF